MKRFIFIALILFLLTNNSAFSLSLKKEEPKSAETIEQIKQINQINQSFEDDEDESFLNEEDIKKMGYGINPSDKKEDLSKKYEEEEIKLDLKKKPSKEKNEESYEKLFKIGIERQVPYNLYKTENMFWDTSKNFLNTYYQDYRNQLPLPTMINSSYLSREMGSRTSVYVGQTALSSFDDITVDFVRANVTTYDVGAKFITQGNKVNFSTGVYNSTLNHRLSGGAVISSNPFSIPKIRGNFVVGGGLYTNELDQANRNTGGVFGQYQIKRLKLNAQIAKSQYSNTNALDTGLYFVPELQLTDSISVKTRFVQNISQNTNQDEIGLTFSPKKNNPRDFELEFNAANIYSDSELTKQRVRFSASFKL